MYHWWRTFHLFTKTCGMAIWVPHAILPMMTQVFMMSPISMSQYKEVWATCLLHKRARYACKQTKLMVAKNYMYYGPWNIAPRLVQKFFLTCQLSHRSKILNNNKINIKTCNNWVAIVKFLQENSPEKAPLTESIVQMKDINVLHAELCQPLEVITHATGRTMGLNAQICSTLWRLCLGEGNKEQSQQMSCWSLQNLGRGSLFQCQLIFLSHILR